MCTGSGVTSLVMSNDWADGIYLDDEQRDLLSWMVESERGLPQNQHDSFLLISTEDGYLLLHPYLGERPSVRRGDLDTLAENLLLRRDIGTGGDPLYDITPQGRRYYAEMKRHAGEAVAVVEEEVHSFLNADAFAASFTCAYQRWWQAETGIVGCGGRRADDEDRSHLSRGSPNLCIGTCRAVRRA